MNALLDQLTHSEMAGTLSLVLAHSLWQGMVVAAVLALLLRKMRRSTAQARYMACCVAMLALVVWPVATFWQLSREQRNVVQAPWSQTLSTPEKAEVRGEPHASGATPTSVPKANPVQAPPTPLQKRENIQNWQGMTLLVWLTGMSVLSLWHLMGWLGLQRLRHHATTTLSEELADAALRLASQMRLPSSIRVRWSSRISGAISFGWLRPVVLLPAAMATGFSMRELEMILAHEFAHLRRHDYVVNLLQSAVETLLFYHPAAWWISGRIRREREHACDDMAVLATGDARGYAQALVRLAESATSLSAESPRLALAAKGHSGLRHRIERLIHPTAEPAAAALRPVSGVAILALVLLAMGSPEAARPLQAEERPIHGPRGSIRDRNGVLLAVSDTPDRQIVFDLEKVMDAWNAKPGQEVPFMTHTKSTAEGREVERKPDIVAIFHQLVHPVLEQHKLAQPFNAQAMRSHYWKHRDKPFAYAKNLSEDQLKHAASTKGGVIGMDVRSLMQRHYPYKALAAHTLGYTTDSGTDKPELGACAMEKALQAELAPTEEKNGAAAGKSLPHGADVYLTLDARHQYIVERALRDSVPAIRRGAVVLMDVQSGDVLAMASVPSFNPNDFIPSISRERFVQFGSDATNPFLNRAVRSFVPGATFKVAVTLAAICDGQERFQTNCTGSSVFGSRTMQCWIGQKDGAHGLMDLRKGLKESCGPYFYQLGNAISSEKYDSIIALLGFGQDVGVGLPENDPGIFPNRAWWNKHRPQEPFTSATIANMSIGQGAIQASPLQLASLMIPVANGGLVWRPRMVDRIAPGGDASREEKRPRKLAGNLRDHGLTQSGLDTLRAGLRDIVTDGPAKTVDLPDMTIAGKTGTAQNWRQTDDGLSVKDNHTIFVAYAPVEKPKWSICVVVQGGKGGGVTAAPIAAHILTQVAEVEAGKRKVDVQPVEPVEGSFEPIDQVEYPLISQ